MYIVIAGSGRLGSGLARTLSEEGEDVAVVDRPIDWRRLGADFDGLTVEGSPLDLEVLKAAGIRKARLFVAATQDDNLNAAAVEAAKGIFKVPMAVARFMDPERERFYRSLGVDTVCPTTTGMNQVLDYIRNAEFSALAAAVDPTVTCVVAREDWIGQPLSRLRPGKGRRVLGLVRDGRLHGAAERLQVRVGDSLVVAREAGRAS